MPGLMKFNNQMLISFSLKKITVYHELKRFQRVKNCQQDIYLSLILNLCFIYMIYISYK